MVYFPNIYTYPFIGKLSVQRQSSSNPVNCSATKKECIHQEQKFRSWENILATIFIIGSTCSLIERFIDSLMMI